MQHMAASLNATGKLGVVLPHGILFRGGTEGKIRTGLLKDDRIEAVIGLASNLFYGTGIPACILIINNAKAEDRKNKVLIINGAEAFQEGKNQNTLSEDNVNRLSKTFHDFQEVERFCRMVALEEIEENDYNLNIARYVQVAEPEPPIDVKEELKVLKDLQLGRNQSESKMIEYLQELGYDA